MKRPRLFLIDGSSYIFRAFHAIPYLSNSKGRPTNAIYGFTQMLLKVIKDFRPDHIAVAFDAKGPSFRHKIYEEYKTHRPEMPDNLKPQIPYVKEIVKALHIPSLELEGYEADDIIGTISRHMKEKAIEVIIIAADKDMLQLIDENTIVVDTMKDKKIDKDEVRERFGVEPGRMVEVMGLAGDASDNIPGVKGIGEKTATKLIQQFGTIENILQNIDTIADKRLRERLKAHAEEAMLSKQLATIDTNAPVQYRFEDLAVSLPDYPALKRLFKELEFTKLLKDVIPDEPQYKGRYTSVTDIQELSTLIAEVKDVDKMAIVVKRQGTIFSEVTGIALCIQPHQAFYIPIGHRSQETAGQLAFHESAADRGRGIAQAFVLETIKPIMEDERIQKISHDIKTLSIFCKQNNIQMRGVKIDTSIATYLLNPSRPGKGIADIAQEELDYRIPAPKPLSYQDIETACIIACSEADAVFQLSERFLQQLKSADLLKLFQEVEIPLAEVLAEMELNGIKVDRRYLVSFSRELEGQIDNLKKIIYTMAKGEFNINSPKQLAEILFERLQLKPIKRTKTGFSTDEEVLTTLALEHELPREIINYRGLSKLKSTYVDALIGLINPETGRVHTSFNQTVTATGRLSSSDPNLQNIPIRTELGKRIREAFTAEDGFLFLSADYSQIELRLVVHLSQDPLLSEAFHRGKDIHRMTASEVFGMPPEGVTEEARRRAKAINFGIIYGMGPYGLSQELGITQDEAKGYIDAYFARYKDVKAFIDKTVSEARERGYTTTLMARRRYIPELLSESESVRRLGERVAINSVIQGTAADIIKVAMVNISRRLKGLSSRMVLQIHDELLLEMAEGELERVKTLVEEEMEGVVRLSVPVKVNIGVGRNWREAGEG